MLEIDQLVERIGLEPINAAEKCQPHYRCDTLHMVQNLGCSAYIWPEWSESNTLHLVPKTSALTDRLHPDIWLTIIYMVPVTRVELVRASRRTGF